MESACLVACSSAIATERSSAARSPMDVVLLPLPENREAKGLRIVMGNVDAGRQGPGRPYWSMRTRSGATFHGIAGKVGVAGGRLRCNDRYTLPSRNSRSTTDAEGVWQGTTITNKLRESFCLVRGPGLRDARAGHRRPSHLTEGGQAGVLVRAGDPELLHLVLERRTLHAEVRGRVQPPTSPTREVRAWRFSNARRAHSSPHASFG